MRSKSITLITAPLLVLFIIRIPIAEEITAKHHVTVVYTNDVRGEIEPCG